MIKSFDVFDTLIGRLCFDGHSIFDFMENKFNINGFKNIRINLEIIHRDIDIIYSEISKYYNNWKELKKYELDLEYKLSFPIRENLNKVAKCDIFVSDMYLKENNISQLLNKHGDFPNKIHVSYDGKKTGKFWSKIYINSDISLHTGDNIKSDYENPKKYNINCHYFDSGFTQNENIMPRFYKNLLRAVRLSFDHDKKCIFDKLFTNFSLQFMILICIKLKKIFIENNLDHVVFLSRDGYWFKYIYEILFKSDNISYLYFSRELVKNNRTHIINNINKINGRKLVFDLQGSGDTFNSLDLIDVHYVLCFKSSKSNHRNCIFEDDIYSIKPYIEDIFSAPHGSARNVIKNKVILNPLEYNIEILKPYMKGIEMFKEYFNTLTEFLSEDIDFDLYEKLLFKMNVDTMLISSVASVIKHVNFHNNPHDKFPLIFYSQIDQDKYYIENVNFYKINGTFLEIGGYDGVTGSNTYFLEKNLNWNGIVIECNPEMAELCKKTRACKICDYAVYKESGKLIDILIPDGKEIIGGKKQLCGIKEHLKPESLEVFKNSYIKNTVIKVKTININELLEKNDMNFIDYLSLDIEGYELELLKSFDFNKYHINFMTVEHGNVVRYQNEIKNFLLNKGFRLHRNNKWDDEYINVRQL